MLVLVCLLLAFIIIVMIKTGDYENNVVSVKSTVDGKLYQVQKNYSRHVQAANKLAVLSRTCHKLVKHLNDKHGKEEAVQRLVRRFDGNNISEGPVDGEYTSFSINKGEKLVFCIRYKDSRKFIDNNTLVFVALHELSHVMSESIGHTDEFWRNFKRLLRLGSTLRLYNPIDYALQPHPYCGIRITNNPMYYKKKFVKS